ncbi:MAG TPA: hypothetical protein VGL77_20085 [Armatimonadota bacterium]|jgi:hypothetical protein
MTTQVIDTLPSKNVFRMTFDILTFRFTGEDCAGFNYRHLLFGLFTSWLVGIGRSWHNPRVAEFQHWGLGSLGVVLGIALLIYLIAWPLRPQRWSFFTVLTFVSLTALPGAVFAVPYASGDVRALLLFILSVWRVGLLGVFICRYSGLKPFSRFLSVWLPCGVTLIGLTLLNLQRATFAIMGRELPTPDNASYELMILASLLSFWITVVLLLVYLVTAICAWLPPARSKVEARVGEQVDQ